MESAGNTFQISRILVPLDGSETAEAILPHVRRILACHDAEVILLRAIGPGAPDIHFVGPVKTSEAEAYLRRMEWALVNEGRRVRRMVRLGSPAGTILEVAAREQVSVIALSTHGRTGLARALYGSVAESVLRSANVPVFLVRPVLPTPPGGPSRGQVESRRFRRVLVPIDGSRNSLEIIPALKALLRPLDARAILLRVYAPEDVPGKWLPSDPVVERARVELTRAEIPVEEISVKGVATEAILKARKEHDVDLVAMATHGRTGAFRMILGSVTEQVLRATDVPMLITRPHATASVEA